MNEYPSSFLEAFERFVENTKDIGPSGDNQFAAAPVDDLILLLWGIMVFLSFNRDLKCGVSIIV